MNYSSIGLTVFSYRVLLDEMVLILGRFPIYQADKDTMKEHLSTRCILIPIQMLVLILFSLDFRFP